MLLPIRDVLTILEEIPGSGQFGALDLEYVSPAATGLHCRTEDRVRTAFSPRCLNWPHDLPFTTTNFAELSKEIRLVVKLALGFS